MRRAISTLYIPTTHTAAAAGSKSAAVCARRGEHVRWVRGRFARASIPHGHARLQGGNERVEKARDQQGRLVNFVQ